MITYVVSARSSVLPRGQVVYGRCNYPLPVNHEAISKALTGLLRRCHFGLWVKLSYICQLPRFSHFTFDSLSRVLGYGGQGRRGFRFQLRYLFDPHGEGLDVMEVMCKMMPKFKFNRRGR